jgi:hypothetical protein
VNILKQRFKPLSTPHIAALLLDLFKLDPFDAAQLSERRQTGGLGRHSSGDILVNLALHVEMQFFAKFHVQSSLSNE